MQLPAPSSVQFQSGFSLPPVGLLPGVWRSMSGVIGFWLPSLRLGSIGPAVWHQSDSGKSSFIPASVGGLCWVKFTTFQLQPGSLTCLLSSFSPAPAQAPSGFWLPRGIVYTSWFLCEIMLCAVQRSSSKSCWTLAQGADSAQAQVWPWHQGVDCD